MGTPARTLPFLLILPVCLQCQELTLNLEEALRVAEGKSEQVAIARAGEKQARGQQIRARAQRLPQINGNAGYTRTLASQFSGFLSGGNEEPACAPLAMDPSAPLSDRIAEIERFLDCGGPSSSSLGSAASSLPFGRTNAWQLGLTFSWPVYAGGLFSAQQRGADAARDAAAIQVDSSNAQFLLDVTQAFYDAALSTELLQIAQANLDEATRTLDFVRLGYQVGRLPEFDVLRSEVTRRNQLPEIARRNAAIAEADFRLRQLLELPMDTPLRLEANLMSDTLPIPSPFEPRYQSQVVVAVREADNRAPVRQADAAVRQSEANLDAARSERLPSVSLSSVYNLFAYPKTLVPTSTDQFRKDWTVGFNVQVPILRFGRIRADIVTAEGGLDQAQAQRKLTSELAQLDSSVALNQLRTAEEEWQASSGTVDQAERAYSIADLRYRQGVSSQLELDDARIALLQSRANRAQAARDLQVARVTVALLPLLPLSGSQGAPGQPTTPQRTQSNTGLGQQQSTNPFQSQGQMGAGQGGTFGSTRQQQGTFVPGMSTVP